MWGQEWVIETSFRLRILVRLLTRQNLLTLIFHFVEQYIALHGTINGSTLTKCQFWPWVRVLTVHGVWGWTSGSPELFCYKSILHFGEQYLDPVIVPWIGRCFYIKMVKYCTLTNVILTTGFESWPFVGYEVEPPTCHSSLEVQGQWILDLPSTDHIFGRRADVPHPRPGSFGPHGHRIDFCERVVLNHFVIKVFCTSGNNNWIQLLFRELEDVFISKWLSTVFSQYETRSKRDVCLSVT